MGQSERRGATQSPPLLFHKIFPRKITFNPFCSCVFLILFFGLFFYYSCLFIVVNDMAKIELWSRWCPNIHVWNNDHCCVDPMECQRVSDVEQS